MKELNLYILEKLKINKDSVKVSVIDKYKEHDRCLLIWFNRNETSEECFLCLNLIEITKVITDNFKIIFKNLGLNGEPETANRRWENINKNRRYAIDDSDNPWDEEKSFGIILPENECVKLLENIERNNFKIDLFNYLGLDYPEFIKDNKEATQKVHYNPAHASLRELNTEDINNIIKLIKEKN